MGANNVDTFQAFYEEMEKDQDNKGNGVSCWTSQPKSGEKSIGASPYAPAAISKEEISCSANEDDASWLESEFSDNDNDNDKLNDGSSLSDEAHPPDWEDEADLFYLVMPSRADERSTTMSLKSLMTGKNNTGMAQLSTTRNTAGSPAGTFIDKTKQVRPPVSKGRRVQHYSEIKEGFIRSLKGSGSFGWPPLTGVKTKKEHRELCGRKATAQTMDDCRVDSKESVLRKLHQDASQVALGRASEQCGDHCNKILVDCCFDIKPQWRSLQEVRTILSNTAEGTRVTTSCSWQKWKQARFKPSPATRAVTSTGNSNLNNAMFTFTKTTPKNETGTELPEPQASK